MGIFFRQKIVGTGAQPCKLGPGYVANGKVTYHTLYTAGVQGGRGGNGLAHRRQKANHRKKTCVGGKRQDQTARPTL